MTIGWFANRKRRGSEQLTVWLIICTTNNGQMFEAFKRVFVNVSDSRHQTVPLFPLVNKQNKIKTKRKGKHIKLMGCKSPNMNIVTAPTSTPHSNRV